MTTYLKRFHFDDWKLRQRALLEFFKALQTGRMIAFTGSMSTEALGYGSWDQLVKDYVEKGLDLVGTRPALQGESYDSAVRAISSVRSEILKGGKSLHDKRVALSIIKEALAAIDAVSPAGDRHRVTDLAKWTAERYLPSTPIHGDRSATVGSILSELGLNRFATLNYDLELELSLMAADDGERNKIIERARAQLNGDGARETDRQWRELMINGRAVESDIRDRERPDRMIDFAVGSVTVDQRIMHLHGRACSPETLIVGLRDYDRLYRKDDLAKLPFEHGQRILFAGNPVLFIGVGMSEPEMNATLQTFVSNNPYRRFAPTFLLWNASTLDIAPRVRAREIALRRLDFLQRLGIFMIFDEDLTLGEGHRTLLDTTRLLTAFKKKEENEGRRLSDGNKQTLTDTKLRLLEGAVHALGRTARQVDDQLHYIGRQWRSTHKRIEPARSGTYMRMWGTNPGKDGLFELLAKPSMPSAKAGDPPHLTILTEIGAGKGSVARLLAERGLAKPFDAAIENRLLINAGFSFDTDSLLSAISRLLLRLQNGDDWEKEWDERKREGKAESREARFAAPDAFKAAKSPGDRKLIIINGMERFFNLNGAPLSAELDHLLRCIAGTRQEDSRINWIFLGSERIERYFKVISPDRVLALAQICRPAPQLKAQLEKVNGVYLSSIIERFDAFADDRKQDRGRILTNAARMILEANAEGDSDARRRATLGAYLNSGALGRAGATDAALCMKILRTMAFIGTAVEDVVLLHAPQVRRHSPADKPTESLPDKLAALDNALKELVRLGLVIEIDAFRANPRDTLYWKRYGLHRAIASELRYQFGIPLSESKLSTAFNMSLYAAQPVDGHVPEPEIHGELAELIDHLIGAYKDELDPSEAADLKHVAGWETRLKAVGESFVPPLPDEETEPARLSPTCTPAASAALRAALAVVRGYYSTTSLLTIDREDRLASDDRDGVLLEHAERLERLLRTYRKLARFRDAVFAECDKIKNKKNRDAARAALGPEPFYPDDIVWIHNELGVVYLAQGDLYSARSAFRQAHQINKAEIEHGCRSHNWRRITVNEVLLNVERGKLTIAEQQLNEIERSIDERPDLRAEKQRGKRKRRRFAAIRRKFGQSAGPAGSCFDKEIMHEEILMTALVLGFRGLCHHIRGRLKVARPLYKDALAIMRRLGEQRAYALFQRHYAQLRSALDPVDQARVEMRFAVAAAESVRQMDMAYHARITQTEVMWLSDPSHSGLRKKALIQANNALSYAAIMDIYRLRIEADIRLARLKLDSGDYETALEHATEAMTLASRFGHSLRKIMLRVWIGRILVRRGDRISGEAMINEAIEAADRFGYQGAIETARRALATEVGLG